MALTFTLNEKVSHPSLVALPRNLETCRKQPRIAVFVPTLAFGGVERVMLNLAQGFCDRGFDVDVVAHRVEGEFRDNVPKRARLVDLQAGRVLASLDDRWASGSGQP